MSFVNRLYRDRYGYLFIAPSYLVFIIFLFLPVLGAIALAFFDTNFVQYTWIGLDNFRKLSTNPGFLKAVKNTFAYVAIVVPITMAISLTIAALIRPLRSDLQTFFRAAFYLPSVTGAVILSLVWTWIFNPGFGLLNFILGKVGIDPVIWLGSSPAAFWSVIVVVLTFTIGQPIILFLAGMEGIPDAIYDAALVDGATSWQRFWYITLPLLRPVFLFVMATSSIGVFQIWEVIFMITSGGPANASTSIVYELYETAFLASRFGLASAMGVVLMIIVVVITLVQFRFWDVSDLE